MNLNAFRLPSSLSLWLFAGSLVMAPLNDVRVVGIIAVCDLLFALATATALAERVLFKEPIPLIPIYLLVAFIYIFRFSYDAVWEGPNNVGAFLVILVAGAITPLAVALMRVKDLEQYNFLIVAWTLGGLIGVFFILAFCNGYFQGHIDEYWKYHSRARGLATHPNMSGLACAMTLPGLFLMFSHAKQLSAKFIILVLLACTLKAVDYTGARAALVFSGVFFAIWLACLFWGAGLRPRINRSQLSLGLLLVAAGIAVLLGYTLATGRVPFLGGVWDRMFGGTVYSNLSDNIRVMLNEQSWEAFKASPILGEGYEWTAFAQSSVAHNMYLQYLHAVGFVGFVAFLCTLIFPLIYPLRHFVANRNPMVVKTNACFLGAAGAVIVWLLAQSSFVDYQAILIFCLPLILLTQNLFARAGDE